MGKKIVYSVEDNFQAAITIAEALVNQNPSKAAEVINTVTTSHALEGSLALNIALVSMLQSFLPETVTREELFQQLRNHSLLI